MIPISENFNLKDFIINMENFNDNSNINKNILNNGINLKNNKIYINYIPLSEELTEYDFNTSILNQTKIENINN